jgi:hypothetical protein
MLCKVNDEGLQIEPKIRREVLLFTDDDLAGV